MDKKKSDYSGWERLAYIAKEKVKELMHLCDHYKAWMLLLLLFLFLFPFQFWILKLVYLTNVNVCVMNIVCCFVIIQKSIKR